MLIKSVFIPLYLVQACKREKSSSLNISTLYIQSSRLFKENHEITNKLILIIWTKLMSLFCSNRKAHFFTFWTPVENRQKKREEYALFLYFTLFILNKWQKQKTVNKRTKSKRNLEDLVVINIDKWVEYNIHLTRTDGAFQQQKLPAWQPVMIPRNVLPALFIVGIIFLPVGGLLYWSSNKVIHEIYKQLKTNRI